MKKMRKYTNIIIYGEIKEGRLSRTTKELFGGGRVLADRLGEQLIAVLIGNGTNQIGEEAVAFGADRVLLVNVSMLAEYPAEPLTFILQKIVEEQMPKVVMLAHSDIGQELGPRLAFRLDTAIVTDCIEISIDADSESLMFTKPIFGEKAMATFKTGFYPQMVTVRAKSMRPLERDHNRKGEIIRIKVNVDQFEVGAKVLEKVREEREGISLEEAEVIITGGRGIGSADGFKELEEVARTLKAVVGATRAACDAGWVPTTLQIGLTGKIVAPKVYFATALSGAGQHMAGCSRSQTIVAVNKDPAAPIFRQAHFGVVGDWKTVLPAFIKKVQELSEA